MYPGPHVRSGIKPLWHAHYTQYHCKYEENKNDERNCASRNWLHHSLCLHTLTGVAWVTTRGLQPPVFTLTRCYVDPDSRTPQMSTNGDRLGGRVERLLGDLSCVYSVFVYMYIRTTWLPG
jgi:hypothetical protein